MYMGDYLREQYDLALLGDTKMKYICPICGEIANPKYQVCIKYETKYERHLTIVHRKCYDDLKKKGDLDGRRLDNSN